MKVALLRLVLCVVLLALGTIASTDRSSSFSAVDSELESFEDEFNTVEPESTESTATNDSEFENYHMDQMDEYEADLFPLDGSGDVQFKPTSLTFRDCPLSITVAQDFELLNTMSFPIVVFGIKSNNRQFHSVLTKQIEVPAGEAYVVRILYLPYRVETVAAEITILTSRGEYRFPITGNSVLNPYRVNPQLGVRFPAGGSILEKPIIVYNPHKETLHITEVFTTEPFLTLKDAAFGINRVSQPLLSADTNSQATSSGGSTGSVAGSGKDKTGAPASSLPELAEFNDGTWSIPPGSEKEVIILSVSTDLKPGNHDGFLHIRTDHDNIVMPIELQILSTLVYPQHEELAFGTLTAPTERKYLDLWVKNNGPTAVAVTEIIPVEPDVNLAIEIAQNPIIYPGNMINSRVARIIYTGTRPGVVANKLLVITNNTNAASAVFDVRYTATVLHGGVRFAQMQTLFFIEVHNKTFIEECQECDTHGNKDGFYARDTELLLGTLDDRDGQVGDSSHRDRVDSGRIYHREMKMTNYFDAPVALLDAKITGCDGILSTDFVPPTVQELARAVPNAGIVVEGMHPWKPINVYLQRALVYALYRENIGYLPKSCSLDITTNVSAHRVPLHIVTTALSIEYMDVPMIEQFDEYVLNLPMMDGSIALDNVPTVSPAARRFADQENAEDAFDFEDSTEAEGDHSSAQGGAEAFSCDGDVCLDSHGNSDIYHIELGNQSITEPRSLRIVLSNNNPIQVPMMIAETSHDICACFEDTWQIGASDSTVVESVLSKTRRRTWIDSKADSERCFCVAPALNGGSPYAAEYATERPVETAETPSAGSADAAAKRVSVFLAEAQHLSVLTIAMRDLSTCRLHPVRLQGFSGTATTECRPMEAAEASAGALVSTDSTIPRLVNNARSTVRIGLHSAHQRLQLHLHFTAKAARLRTRIAPAGIDHSMGGQFVIGTAVPLTLRSRSSFASPLSDMKLSVAPNMLYRLEFDQAVVSAPNAKSWYTGLHVSNVCADRTPGGPIHDFHQGASDGKITADETMRSVSLWRCAHNLLTGLNFTDAYNTSLLNGLRRQENHMVKYLTTSPQAAFTSALKLKQTWLMTFPSGIPLPHAVVHMEAAQTTHSYVVDNATLQTPHMLIPHSYSVHVPTARVGQVQWFYLHIHNPFDLAVSFSLLDESTSETSKRMRALGGLFFQPAGLEPTITPRTAPALSRYQCMGVSLGTNVRVSRTPIPCECKNPGNKLPNETFCEVDLGGPVELSANVDVAQVHRSRSLSMVDGVVAFASSSSALAGLNKIFSADIEPMATEGGISGDTAGGKARSNAAEQDLPFLPQSTLSTAWVNPPRGVGKVGPFLYAPRGKSPGQGGASDVGQETKSSFFLFNNFTGFDKVDIYTSSALPDVTLAGLSSCVENSAASDVYSRSGRDCTQGQWQDQSIAQAVTAGGVHYTTAAVSQLGQYFRVRIRNTGAVNAMVQSVHLDGRSCPKGTGALVTFGLFTLLDSFFGASTSTLDLEELGGMCSDPVQLTLRDQLEIWVKAPSTCAYGEVTRVVTIALDEALIAGTGGDGAMAAADSKITVKLAFQLDPELLSECLHRHSSPWTHTLLMVFAFMMLVIVLWQILAVGLLSKQQRDKYIAARNAKSNKRNRSKRSASSATNPPAHALPSGAAHPYPADEYSGRMDDRASNERWDLSDVLIPTAAEANGHSGSALGETAPKLRAVEALLAARSLSKIPESTLLTRSPPKLTVTTDFTAPALAVVSKGRDVSNLISPSTVTIAGHKPTFGDVPVTAAASMSPSKILRDNNKSPAKPAASVAPTSAAADYSAPGRMPAMEQAAQQHVAHIDAPLSHPAENVLLAEDDTSTEAAGMTSSTSDLFDTSTGAGLSGPVSSADSLAEASSPSPVESDLAASAPSAVSANAAAVTATAPVAAAVGGGDAADKKSRGAKAAATKQGKNAPAATDPADRVDGTSAPQSAPVASAAPPPVPTAEQPKKAAKDNKSTKKATASTGSTGTAEKLPSVVEPAAPAPVPPVPAQPAGKGKNKGPLKPPPNLVAASLVTSRSSNGIAAAAEETAGAKEPTGTTGNGAHSPLRLRPPSGASQHSAAEDSPLFRYSGQLLDDSRDSSAALDLLVSSPAPAQVLSHSFATHFPAGVTGATLPGSDILRPFSDRDRDSSLLPDTLSEGFSGLWPLQTDTLTLDIGLDLGVSGPSVKSPQDILNAGPVSELRVTADPFYSSMTYDSVNGRARLRSDSSTSGGRQRAESGTGSSYLTDLLATAQAAALTALDSTDNAASYEAREWFPSATLQSHRTAPTHQGIDRSQQDGYFADHLEPARSGHWAGDGARSVAGLNQAAGYAPQAYQGDRYEHPQASMHDSYGQQRVVHSHPPGFARNSFDGRPQQPQQQQGRGMLYQEDHRMHGYPQAGGNYADSGDFQRPSGPFFDRVDRNNRLDGRYQQVPPLQTEHELLGRYRTAGYNAEPARGYEPQPQQQQRGVGMRQHSAPVHTRNAQEVPMTLTGHSFDFLDDNGLDEDASSWVRNLTHQPDAEHSFPHRGGGVTQHSQPSSQDYRYQQAQPQPPSREYQRGPPASAFNSRAPPVPASQMHAQHNPQQQQQQLQRLEQLRHQRHQQPPAQAGAHPAGGAYTPPHRSHYGAPMEDFHLEGSPGYNPFARPDAPRQAPGALGHSPGRDGEGDRWLALNAAGGALPGLRNGPGGNLLGSPQTRPVSQALPQYAPEFPSPEAAAVAAELQFFHPQGFFGEPALGGLAFEALEDDEG